MRINRLLLGIFGLTFLCNPGLFSRTQEHVIDLLVSTDWLEENLSDSLLVIQELENVPTFSGMNVLYTHIRGVAIKP
jgi:hypothetical protein